jgi:hypothetical protein
MIARVWRGYTTPENAPHYEKLLKPELLPGISRKAGYRGSYLLRRNSGSEVEFITILLFDSLDDVRAAAGHDDYETAIIPVERQQYLLRYDAEAAHYDVASTNGLTALLG